MSSAEQSKSGGSRTDAERPPDAAIRIEGDGTAEDRVEWLDAQWERIDAWTAAHANSTSASRV